MMIIFYLVYFIGQHSKRISFRQGFWSFTKQDGNKDLEMNQKRFGSTQDVQIVKPHSKVTKHKNNDVYKASIKTFASTRL